MDSALAASDVSASRLDELGIEAITDKPVKGISEYKLKSNGLDILLVERHETPVVMTTMVFHVGSRNEAVGYTGSTHFLEHMMFKGTERIDPLKKNGIDDLLKKVGGTNNATTWFDRTNYFEMVPAGHLDLCLRIEADRLRNLLLRESDRKAEMTVVRNELERGEDDPSQLLETNLFATAFREHPYHHPTIGWRSDVEGVPTSRLKAFYDEFYWPNNATLIVIGDFDTTKTLASIASLFGSIPKSPAPIPNVYTTEPPQEGERRFVVKRGNNLPRLTIGFHIPRALDKDTYALDVAQTILGDSNKPSSRLYKRLIDSGLASEVSCVGYSLRDPGLFVINAQANVGVDLSKLENAILDELRLLQTAPVKPAELAKAKKSITKGLRLDISDPMGLSSHLTEAIAVANWKWWLSYPQEIEKVTANQVQTVCRRYFQLDNRTVGRYYPKGGTSTAQSAPSGEEHGSAAKTGSPQAVASAETAKPDSAAADTEADGDAAGSPQVNIDIGKRVHRLQLKNGITVLVLPLKGSTTVAVSAKLNSGDYFAQRHATSVPGLVADLLNKGSVHFSKQQIADTLENMGAHLEISAGTYCTGADTEVVREDLDKLLAMLADMLCQPVFPAEELKLEKSLQLSDIKEKMADTGDVSWNILVRKLYKPNSAFYEKDYKDQISEIQAIKRADLVSFHKRFYKPSNMTLALVGDISDDQAEALCRKHFSAWQGQGKDSINPSASELKLPARQEKVVADLPDKANADVVIAKALPVSIKSPDYFAAVLGNAALGFDSFACRLAPVRDKYGLSYHISSKMEDPMYPFGPWAIKFSVNPANLKKAQDLVSSIVSDYLSGGITGPELRTEKSHLSGLFFVQLRSPKQIATALTSYEAAGVKPSYIDEFAGNLDKVSVDDVNAAIRKYFKLDDAVTSISGTFNRSKPNTKR